MRIVQFLCLLVVCLVPSLAQANANFPKEPAGFTQLNDMPWNCVGCNGWTNVQNVTNGGVIVSDSTTTGVTASPTNVLQLRYDIGFQIGVQPVTMSVALPSNHTDVFLGYWYKYSNPWQPNSAGVDKQFFVWQVNAQFHIILQRYFGTLIAVLSGLQPTTCNNLPSGFGGAIVQKCGGSPFAYPNQGIQSFMDIGVWNKVEMFIHPSSGTNTNDGVLRVWLNGTKILDYPNLNFEVANWDKVQLAPDWGGNGTETKTELDFSWVDHTYVSTGTPSVDSTPPTTPTSFTATANGAGANLAWTNGTDLNGIANSTVFRCTGAACTPVTLLTTVAGTSTTYTDPGPLTVGTVYGWAVKNSDPTGNVSGLSNIAYLTAATPPSTPTFIQDCSGAFHAGSTQVFTSATCTVTAGHLLVGIMTFDNTAGTTTLSTVTGGGTWAKATACSHPTAGNSRIEIWYAANATGGSTTATATLSAADVNGGFMMVEYGGVATTAPLEKVACQKIAAPGTTTDAVTSGSQTTTVNGELIVGGALAIDGTATIAGTGFNSRVSYFNDIRLEDKVQPSAGAVAATFTGATGTVDYLAAMATFLAIGTATTPPSMTLNAPDATGANLSWSATTPPTQIRIATGSSFGQYSSTIYPLSAFSPSGTNGRYTNTWVGGLTFECAFPIDVNGVENTAGRLCNTLVNIAPPADVTPPVMSNGLPTTAFQSGTTSAPFQWTVNEPSICKWDTNAAHNTFASMTNSASVSGFTVSGTVTGLTDGTTTHVYGLCEDTVDPLLGGPNIDTTPIDISVTVSNPPTTDTTAPSTVTNLVCTALGETQANCSWVAATDNVAVAGYQLYVGRLADGSDAGPVGSVVVGLSGSLANLQPNTSYYVFVKAIDTSNNYSAALSNSSSITTSAIIDVTAPSDMTNLRVQLLFSQSAQLTWDLGTDDSGSVTTTIEICTGTIATCADTDFVFRVSKIALNYLVVTLSPNTTYVARGKFSDLSGNVSVNYSNKVEFTTLASGLPQPRVFVPFTGRTTTTSPVAAGTRVPR